MKPHKHAELIKAWADGAEIQSRNIGENWVKNDWPVWAADTEYRIKPKQPVIRWKWAYQCNNVWYETEKFSTEEDIEKYIGDYIKLEYTRTEFPK
jgi:hypothetical protein